MAGQFLRNPRHGRDGAVDEPVGLTSSSNHRWPYSYRRQQLLGRMKRSASLKNDSLEAGLRPIARSLGDACVIVACSGGHDSVALLHAAVDVLVVSALSRVTLITACTINLRHTVCLWKHCSSAANTVSRPDGGSKIIQGVGDRGWGPFSRV